MSKSKAYRLCQVCGVDKDRHGCGHVFKMDSPHYQWCVLADCAFPCDFAAHDEHEFVPFEENCAEFEQEVELPNPVRHKNTSAETLDIVKNGKRKLELRLQEIERLAHCLKRSPGKRDVEDDQDLLDAILKLAEGKD